jgi:hypothetical protein
MITVRVRAEPQGVRGSQPFEFVLTSASPRGGRVIVIEKSRFLIP